ncbi:MAG: hypothetical protein EAY66_08240 [Sphingobacteriales bacterium]|nr:MAG: hypothetical protein EAY66_08240 [Sphingobacteriales bacterium]
MKFLSPNFLFALFALAIPVLIHLFNFRKFKKVYFTNVRFLQAIQQQTAHSQKLKNLLILASRLLALFFLVMAFAQPYWPNATNNNQLNRNKVSIYIDNSFSMEAINSQGTLLDEAKRRAIEITDSYDLNTQFQLLSNNFTGQQQRFLSKSEFLEALNNIKITSFYRDYQTVINRQSSLLLPEANSNKTIYLLSDFQQQNPKPNITANANIKINLVPIQANAIANVSIDSAYFLSPIHQPGIEEKLVVRLKNHSDVVAQNIPIKLKINGQQKAMGNINIAARQNATDTLSFSGLSAGWQQVLVTIKDYPIVFDDSLLLSFEVKKQVSLLNIYNNRPNKNITTAYQTDAFFNLTNASESQINYAGLQNYQLIILSNLPTIASGLAQQLQQYVQNGGSLAVFMPLGADLSSYQNFLKTLPVDYPTAINNQPLNADKINIQHPFFANVFDQLPRNLDLPKMQQYFEMSNLTQTSRQTLIYGGGDKNLLAVYKIKKGKVYVSAIPLEAEFSNFTNHALFLPVLFKMALSGFGAQKLFETLGSNGSITIPVKGLMGDNVLKISNKNTQIIPEVRQSPAGTQLFFADQLQNPDFYKVTKADSLLAITAFNYNRSESDMRYYDENTLKNIFKNTQAHILSSGNDGIKSQIKQSVLGTNYWKLCLILVLLFLAIEILLIRFFNQRQLKQT